MNEVSGNEGAWMEKEALPPLLYPSPSDLPHNKTSFRPILIRSRNLLRRYFVSALTYPVLLLFLRPSFLPFFLVLLHHRHLLLLFRCAVASL